ncbi:MAG: BrnA antitoxin family protein [Acidobacteriaceae bacterium]
MTPSIPTEQRFVSIGTGAKGRALIVVYSYRAGTRFASSQCDWQGRTNTCSTRRNDETAIRFQQRQAWPDHDPGAGTGGKTRITIRIDDDLIDHFLKEAERSGGSAGYQTLVNDALRQHVEGKAPKLEDTLRRILREEIKAAS